MNALALVLSLVLAGASPQVPTREWEDFESAIAAEDATQALREARELVEHDERDPQAWFALVRAQALAGDIEATSEALRRALGLGFVDLHRFARDPVLEELRTSDLGVWLFENWRDRLDTRAEKEAAALSGALGDGYSIEVDETLRVRVISALDDELTAFAREELVRVHGFSESLFPAATEDRPDPWVLVILPTPEDARRLLPDPRASGVYDHDRKGLVVTDIGPALRHEFFHALHWRHMERLGQRHPVWVREGLATLVEDVHGRGDTLEILPSWRTNIAKRLARIKRLRPWVSFAQLDARRFTGTRPVSNYAQARALYHWLHDTDRLEAWYAEYTTTFDEDPTSPLDALIAVADDGEAWEPAFRDWLIAQDDVGVAGERNPTGLGVVLRDGAGDGPVVDQTGFDAQDGVRLRPRDVIRSVGGVQVRTLAELYRELGERRPGDVVEVELDRRGQSMRVRIELVRESETLGLR